jgi:mannose-6-phosphate isomerase-like protein (cupin superfamily)
LYRVPSASIPQELDGELIVDGTIVADKIQASSITVDKLSGDVSEAFSFGLYNATSTSLSSSMTTFGEFTTPAPDANIKKAAVLHATFGINASSPSGDFSVGVSVQRKSKGVTSGTALGSVVANGSIALGARYIEISGNLLTQIDMYGGIATTQTSPSSVYNIISIEFQSSTSRTRIIYASDDVISSGTIYYNADKWTSSGTYLTYSPFSVHRYGIIGVNTLTHHVLFQPLAKSNAEETYRIRAQTFVLSSGSASMTVGLAGQIHLMR